MIKNKQSPAHWAVIPAAGVGKRMKAATPKQYISLNGKSILYHTVSRFILHPKIDGIVVAISKGDEYWPEVESQILQLQQQCGAKIPIRVAPGGNERSDSVLNALKWIEHELNSEDWVLVHDAARPCLRAGDIDKLIETLSDQAIGGLLGLPMADTVKFCNANGRVEKTIDRRQLWRALTPQMFRHGMLLKALNHASNQGLAITDESSAMEIIGHQPMMIEGHNENIKITHPGDLALAEKFMLKGP